MNVESDFAIFFAVASIFLVAVILTLRKATNRNASAEEHCLWYLRFIVVLIGGSVAVVEICKFAWAEGDMTVSELLLQLPISLACFMTWLAIPHLAASLRQGGRSAVYCNFLIVSCTFSAFAIAIADCFEQLVDRWPQSGSMTAVLHEEFEAAKVGHFNIRLDGEILTICGGLLVVAIGGWVLRSLLDLRRRRG